jgi:multiple sugar transport system permease protein
VHKTRTRAALIGRYLLLTVLALVFFFPVLWSILGSFKSPRDIIAIPPKFFFEPTLDNYLNLEVSSIPIFGAFMNSVVISVTSTLLALAFSALAGYSLGRLRPRGGTTITTAILVTRMIPPIVLIIPLFLFYSAAGMLDTLVGLIIPYTALNIPLATLLLMSFFETLPRELDEAAAVDGCGIFRTFWSITLPLTAPGLVAAAIFSFALAWNDFMLALPLTSRRAIPMTIVASMVRTEEGVLWGKLNVIVVIMIIPMAILTILAQRRLVSGLVAGSVKE